MREQAYTAALSIRPEQIEALMFAHVSAAKPQ
jgi:hypothetical protein